MSATTSGRNSASDPEGNVIRLAPLLSIKPNTDESRSRMSLQAADITAETDRPELPEALLQSDPLASEIDCCNSLKSCSRKSFASSNPCENERCSCYDKLQYWEKYIKQRTSTVIVEQVHEPLRNTSGRGYVLLRYLFIKLLSIVILSSPP